MESIVPTTALTQLPFAAACEAWLESRRPYLSAKTHHEYKLNIKTLAIFFGELRLQEIDADLIRAYQRTRKLKVGASAINHECGLLCLVRKRIGMPISREDYQPLALPKEKPGRVLSDEERARLLRVAASNPNWEAAYLFAVVSVNTTAGPKEVASLRFKDVDLERKEIHIPPHGAKNISRSRPIPLNDEAMTGIMQAMDRARRLGSSEPQHSLFPFRLPGGNRHSGPGQYDPNRHQTTFKTGWKKAVLAARLGNLQMYDLRRHSITVMLENPEISDETVEEIAGHTPNSRTKKRYSYIRVHARRQAVDAIGPKKAVPKKSAAKEGRSTRESKKHGDRDQLVSQLSELLTKLLKSA